MIPVSAWLINSLFTPTDQRNLYLLDPEPKYLRIGPFAIFGKALVALRDNMRRGRMVKYGVPLAPVPSDLNVSEWVLATILTPLMSAIVGCLTVILGLAVTTGYMGMSEFMASDLDSLLPKVLFPFGMGITMAITYLVRYSPLRMVRNYLQRNLVPLAVDPTQRRGLINAPEPKMAWNITTNTQWHPAEVMHQAELSLYLMARGAWEADEEMLETGKALATKANDLTPYKLGTRAATPTLPATASARPAADVLTEARALVASEPDVVDYSTGTEIIAYPHGAL